VCSPKDQGGLGIHDLEVKNTALLRKWLFKLLTEEGTWKTISLVKKLCLRFFGNLVIRINFWAGLMATKKFFFGLGYFSIKDGSEIRFWEDKWLGNATLREQYLALYSIVRHKGDTIAKVMETSPPTMAFRRELSGQRLVA
jgi:hypothetical protein